MQEFDLIIIGGGPAGYTAAIRAAQYGLDVALVEKNKVGGTCLNRGCVPTKALLHTAELYKQAKESFSQQGLHCSSVEYNVAEMYAKKDEIVAQLQNGIHQLLKANKISLFEGVGTIEKENMVCVNQEYLNAKSILIATGSAPSIPPIEGVDGQKIVTSDDLLKTPKIYENIVIIGAGVIGVEFAAMYTALGKKVTLLEFANKALPTLSREIGQSVSMMLKKRGATLITSANVKKINHFESGVECFYEVQEKIESVKADAALIATGRKPVTDTLFAEALKPNMDKGFVVVDTCYKTSIDGIYAVGDVIGGMQLAHAASAQAIQAVDYIAKGKIPEGAKYIPACIYTTPEIATVGLQEEKAKEQNMNVTIQKFLMGGNARSIIETPERSYIKLIADSTTNIVLGGELLCPRATDLIGTIALAIQKGLTTNDIESIVWPHPTISEGIGEVASMFDMGAIHATPKKKK